MKKSLCILLSLIVISLTLCSCSFIKDENAGTGEPVTDENGVTVSEEDTTAKDGKDTENKESKDDKTSASDGEEADFTVAVTDKNGEPVTKKDGSVVTSKVNTDDIAKDLEDFAKKNAASTTKNSKNGNSGSESTAELYESNKEDLLDDGKKVKNTNLLKTVIEPVVKSGTYTLDSTVKTAEMDIPMVTTFKGDNFAAEMTLDTGSMKIAARIVHKDGKNYMVIPLLAAYGELDDDSFDDYSSNASVLDMDVSYVKSTTVKDGKTTLTCEEYKSKDGTVSKYYFDEKNQWKRLEILDGDTSIIYIVNSFTKTSRDNLFVILKTYTKMDLGDF